MNVQLKAGLITAAIIGALAAFVLMVVYVPIVAGIALCVAFSIFFVVAVYVQVLDSIKLRR